MNIRKINGNEYRLPNGLNGFQLEMYVHLIDWKWANITREAGHYQYKGGQIAYDAILPDSVRKKLPAIYSEIREDLKGHHARYPFKLHEHFNHMASSQAANVNLFLPVLLNSRCNEVFSRLKPDFSKLATDHLDKGFRIEFWDGAPDSLDKGLLGDHNKRSGTDADIGIAYYNHDNELCLWLIEHKLTEAEFTDCGGFKSKGRKAQHDCSNAFSSILKNKHTCYYHDVRKFNYWSITESNHAIFANNSQFQTCPFQGGTNQLWRNQLLALALEQRQDPYKHVYFSVVRHPCNTFLDDSIRKYKELIAENPKFSVFTSQDVVEAAEKVGDASLQKWSEWYRKLYNIQR